MAASVIVHRLAWPRVPISCVTAIHRHSSEVSVTVRRVVEPGAAISSSSEISVRDRRVVACSAAAGRCQVLGGVRTLGSVCGSNFQRLGSHRTTAPSNKRVKYVPCGHPTRKSEALLLAAYAQRWADTSRRTE